MGKIDDESKHLGYISDIRIFVTLMVVFYHSFELYVDDNCGVGFPKLSVYQYIDVIIGLVQMPMFVFISGYLFGLQYAKGRYTNFSHLLKKKTQRVLTPLVVFGVAYYLFMPKVILDNVVWYYSIGHLWFLDMLFECFILQWCFRNLNVGKQILVAFVMTALSTKVPLYFGFNTLCAYFVYFNIGYQIGTKNTVLSSVVDKYGGGKLACFTSALAILSVYIVNSISFSDGSPIMHSCFRVYKVMVSILLCISVMKMLANNKHKDTSMLRAMDYASFGIYLIHPFVMFVLLYRVDWINEMSHDSPYIYQISMFIFLVLASFTITSLLKKIWFLKKNIVTSVY